MRWVEIDAKGLVSSKEKLGNFIGSFVGTFIMSETKIKAISLLANPSN